jgi:2-(1,2-epoxy-1,2-dihydrophenyl)acetyl-CoA isomerase
MSIEIAIEGSVGIVTLNRPAKRNALSIQMRTDFPGLLQSLQEDVRVRAVVIRGAGADFSAGADVSEMGAADIRESLARMRTVQRMVAAVASVEKPVVAAVCGVCAGVAWSMALAADFIITAPDSRFQFAFRNLGLASDGGAAFLLTRHVGAQRAKEILYSGRVVDGAEALQLGLALESVASCDVFARALHMAADLARGPTLALSMMKRQFTAASGQTLNDAMELEYAAQSLMSRTEDSGAAVAAFANKRPPQFDGK